MNVLLPYSSFSHSIAVLDRERLGKQRFDCRQVLVALRAARQGRPMSYDHLPTIKLWRGYESALAVYYTLCIREWVARDYTNTMVEPYDENWIRRAGEDTFLDEDGTKAALPRWLGDEKLHQSHRNWLSARDNAFYSQLGWGEHDHGAAMYWPENPAEI